MTALDHLVVAAPDLTAAIDDFEAGTGIRPEFGGAHEGLGTHNALVSFGANYLELIAPDPNQPDPVGARPFGVDDLTEPTLVTFAVRPEAGDTIDGVVEAARAAGHDPGVVIDMHRIRPDGERLAWRLTFPDPATSNLVPFVIDWGATTSPTSTAPGGVTLESFQVRLPDAAIDIRSRLDALGAAIDIVEHERATLFVRVRGPGGTMEFGG